MFDTHTEWFDNYTNSQEERIQHSMFIIKKHVKKPSNILEIGAYPYIMTQEIIKTFGQNATITTIDKNNTPSKINTVEHHNIDITKHRIPLHNNTQNVIICNEVIEHLNDMNILVSEIERVLAPNGIVLLTTPNLYKLETIYNFIIGNGLPFMRLEDTRKYSYRNYNGHVREYSQKELKTIFKLYVKEHVLKTYKTKNNRFFYIIKKMIPWVREQQIMILQKNDEWKI